jgi:hypothetical protein
MHISDRLRLLAAGLRHLLSSVLVYANHLKYFTLCPIAAKYVDPAVVARCESVSESLGRQGAFEEGVGSSPGRELGPGASGGTQAC